MRLFIAVDLPDSIKKYMHKLQESLPHANVTLAHGFHLTLKFLGECSEEKKIKIEKALEGIAFPPFEMELTGVGVFGGMHPRVVWIGLKVPNQLNQAVAEIEKRMENLGFISENRFTPHITLARVKYVQNPRQFLDSLSKIQTEKHSFKADSFYLFESKLSSAGALYIKLKQFSSSLNNS